MGSRVDGFTLGLPEAWVAVDPVDEAWPVRTAEELGNQALLEPLVAVAATVADLPPGRAVAAVWVPHPELDVVSALLVGQVLPGGGAQGPEAFADEAALAGGDPALVSGTAFVADVPAGSLGGARLLLGHLDPELGTAALEERAVAGVFPAGSPDAVELVLVTSGPLVLDDAGQSLVDLAGSLEIVWTA